MPLPVFDQGQYELLLAARRRAARNVIGRQYDVNDAEYGALPLDENLIYAQRRQNDARLNTIGAGYGVSLAQRGVNQAGRGVIAASEQQLQQERGLIGLEQQQLGESNADRALIRSARDDVPDKSAVAREGLARSETDARIYGRLGVAAPADVDTPPGAEAGLGLGTRASLRTKEQIVRGQVADREADRQAQLQAADYAVKLSATNETEAELAARSAGLSLADARLLVDDAQRREELAGVDTSNARLDSAAYDVGLKRLNLDVDKAKLYGSLTDLDINDLKGEGTDLGLELYRDPYTRELSWKSPADADELQYQYETKLTRQRIPTQVEIDTERRKATQEANVKQNPMYYFDDSDFVWFLSQGINTGQLRDAANNPILRYLPPAARERALSLIPPDRDFTNRVARVREALIAKYPGISPDQLQVKLEQYINSARATQAKMLDEGVVPQPSGRR